VTIVPQLIAITLDVYVILALFLNTWAKRVFQIH